MAIATVSGEADTSMTDPPRSDSLDLSKADGMAMPLGAALSVAPNFPPPKTDKPRPHICTTCTRPFARLEHLKRHERSHTKEKPFACNECTRCFARRDLLLRHQQKLHMTVPPSSRGRRRESTSTNGPGDGSRVRKNSMASNSAAPNDGSIRPRANTISHVDSVGILGGMHNAYTQPDINLRFSHSSIGELPGVGSHAYRGMSSGHHGLPIGLPKLETKNRHIDVGSGLRTAPPMAGFAEGDMDMNSMMSSPGSTINPAQLHFVNSPHGTRFDSPSSPFNQSFPGMVSNGMVPNEGDNHFNWLTSFDQRMNLYNENAVENSSPSAADSGSPEGNQDVLMDGSHPAPTSGTWLPTMNPQMSTAPEFHPELIPHHLPDMYPSGPLSPKSSGMHPERYFSTPPPQTFQTPHLMFSPNQVFPPSFMMNPDTPTNSAASISSSNRQSSVTSASTDSITDATRKAVLSSLSDSGAGYSYSRTSQWLSSPLAGAPNGARIIPSTTDLRRFVGSYIQYFHPHLPFLHVATLSFDSPAFTSNLQSLNANLVFGQSSVAGGGGALVLIMAAIGALYEYDFDTSKDLFEASKTMIQLYLQERQKVEMAAAATTNGGAPMDSQNTPLWLVQAMLLNVIYGHNSGDKTAAGIANTHCAALISLARSANLVNPPSTETAPAPGFQTLKPGDLHTMSEEPSTWGGYAAHPVMDLENEWHNWKYTEEKKRTLYAIFILSSLIVSAYDSAPALMNSEIRLDLPCDEHLWSADSAESWRSLGGSVAAAEKSTPFASALSYLLTATQRQRQRQHQVVQAQNGSLNMDALLDSELKPSTFGCLILINAVHNYIWETRQRHAGRQWTPQETEAMHAHIEPALRAWQAAWSASPDHSLERPNPFGSTSLSADCIPLLDLAYVRLFVNLGRSKEAFFRRDFDAMAEELAHGSEIVQHAEHSAEHSPRSSSMQDDSESGDFVKIENDPVATAGNGEITDPTPFTNGSKRESHLRKAAFCAANSLVMSDRLNVTFADYNSKELPLQSGLCAFDCAQILAEWVSTLQQRVGRYMGVLGRDEIDLSQPPACLFLEEDDVKLLNKTSDIMHSLESKLARSGTADPSVDQSVELETGGYACKILSLHAKMFERQATWPLCREMAQALRTQAAHIKEKVDNSLGPLP